MDTFDPNQLDELLGVLRDNGVSRFSCPAFTVDLAPIVEKDDTDPDIARVLAKREQEAASKRERLGPYAHPSLWPNGSPPAFQGKAAAESPYKDV